MSVEEYDLVILGGGTGSTVAAWTFAAEGQRVAVIERDTSADRVRTLHACRARTSFIAPRSRLTFEEVKSSGVPKKEFTVDMHAVRERKRSMVSAWNAVYLDNYKKSGAEFILGSGRFIGPRTLEVTLPEGATRQLRGRNVIVSTGTRAVLDGIPGLVDAQPLTHVEALELDDLPEHLLVIGGGYVGLELSQAMRRFGSKVSLIDRNDRLLHREDDDVTEAIQQLFEDEGIDLVLNATIKSGSGKSGLSVKIVIERDGKQIPLQGSHLLVAAGRAPNTGGIGLELTSVETTATGYIKVNERLE